MPDEGFRRSQTATTISSGVPRTEGASSFTNAIGTAVLQTVCKMTEPPPTRGLPDAQRAAV